MLQTSDDMWALDNTESSRRLHPFQYGISQQGHLRVQAWVCAILPADVMVRMMSCALPFDLRGSREEMLG